MSSKVYEALFQDIDRHMDEYMGELCDFLRIPGVSTYPDGRENMEKAAEWILEKLRTLQSLREHQELRSHAVVAIYEVLIYMCHAIDRHMDIAMRVSVSDGIRFTLKVLGKLFFQLFRHFLLRDGG